MFIHMVEVKPQSMRISMNKQSSVIYRKKPEPCKIVTFSSLNKTDSGNKKLFHSTLINSDGNISPDSWAPITVKSNNIEINSSGWNGLISRYNRSKLEVIEVA